MTDQKRILYVEQNTDGTVGGSHFSLLFLIQGLNKVVYSPLVAFYQKNYLIPRFRDAGAKILLLNKPQALDLRKSLKVIKSLENRKIIEWVISGPLLVLQKIYNYFITFVFPSFACWNVIRREGIDLVHLNNTLLRPQQWILASLFTKAKIIAHERGINNWFPFQTRFWARFLKRIICISDAVKNNLSRHGFPEEQLFRIYNGLDPDKFSVTLSKKEVLKDLGVGRGNQIVGIIGNIRAWKGQKTVIRSMKHVKEVFPRVKCLIIGESTDTDKHYLLNLEKIAEKEGLKDSIIFTGQRKDIPNLINAFDIFIHASVRPEPFGRVILEAMALKKPVVATNIGAPPEIMVDGKTGLLVPPGKPEALANAILNLLSNPKLAKEMGKAGYDRLVKDFTVSKNVQQTEAIYNQILGS